MTTPRLIALLLLSAVTCLAADLPIGRLGPDYGNWTATGTAFRKGPASGSLLTQLEIENARDAVVLCSEIEGDGPQGTLTSPAFTIEKPYIAFRIGGGHYEIHTCLNLLIDGKVAKSATGWNSDRLMPASWDVRLWRGRTARMQIVDHASGNWGHLNVADLVQTDSPEQPPPVKAPLYQESLRPQFHFTARQWTTDRLNPGMRQDGWLNDLNGLIYHDGEYHLFAQRWNKCWIHAVSTNLIHWTELEPAFWEEQLDSGVQSGTCVVDSANSSGLGTDPRQPPMIAFWSRNDNRSHGISFSLDRGRTWRHHDKNPIFVHPERDPKVFWHGPTARWVMFLYGEQSGERLYHIFTSTNLLSWRDEEHPIKNSYECPDFFQLPIDGDTNRVKWVLVRADGKYSLGTFNGVEFKEETAQFESDSGPNFYATQSWEGAPGGRRIQTAWMRGADFVDMPFSQMISFPCELSLRTTPAGPRLFRKPIQEIALLRRGTDSWTNRTLTANQTLRLAPAGQLFHITADVEIPDGAKLTFNLRGIPVTLTATALESGHKPAGVQGRIRRVELLVDRTSIEAFANEGEISSTRYVLPKGNGISVKAEGGSVQVHSLTVHSLNSAWPLVTN